MKNIVVSLLLAGLSTGAMARGGDESARIPSRGSQASFVLESIEHSVRSLITLSGIAESTIKSAQSEVIGDLAEVVIGLTDGSSVEFKCSMVEESSRGGTVIKKEVRCSKAQ